jgi:hypothetical protein
VRRWTTERPKTKQTILKRKTENLQTNRKEQAKWLIQ